MTVEASRGAKRFGTSDYVYVLDEEISQAPAIVLDPHKEDSARWVAACSAAEDAAKHGMSGESMAMLRELVLLLQHFMCQVNWMKMEVSCMAAMNEPARDLLKTRVREPKADSTDS